MPIYAYNDTVAGIDDWLRYEIEHEFVGGLLVENFAGSVRVPDREFIGQWRGTYLCATGHDAQRPWVATGVSVEACPIEYSPDKPFRRAIGAWTTFYGGTMLARGIQTDRVIQWHGDYPFLPSGETRFGTNGLLKQFNAGGFFPPRFVASALMRGEAARVLVDSGKPGGFAQINVQTGNGLFDGCLIDHQIDNVFRHQVKAYTEKDQPEAYDDNVRVVIPTGPNEDKFFVGTSDHSIGYVAASGIEMRPVIALPPVMPPPAAEEGTTGTVQSVSWPGGYTIVDRSWSLDVGRTVTHLASQVAGQIKIVHRTAAGSGDVIRSVASAGGWAPVAITPFVVPGAGYHLALFPPAGSHASFAAKVRAYAPGDIAGNGIAMTEDTGYVLGVRAIYQSS